MKLVPTAISRKVASQVLLGKKHSPTILFGAGVIGMVGSTILACRSTLKLEETLEKIASDQQQAKDVHSAVNSEGYTGEASYSDAELKKDLTIITSRGVSAVTRLYAPAALLGAVSIACLTKSHKILQERNVALTAAYVAVDNAFRRYRERVVDKYGEEADRNFRYETEQVDIIDDETGEVISTLKVAPGDQSMYSRWFDEENGNWNPPEFIEYNWTFLRQQQNWANDMLLMRGHVTLNEVYGMLGLSHTSAGSVVGWVLDPDKPKGDNYIDFGLWEGMSNQPHEHHFNNGRDGAILLDFNVDGLIWHLLDEIEKRNEEARRVSDG